MNFLRSVRQVLQTGVSSLGKRKARAEEQAESPGSSPDHAQACPRQRLNFEGQASPSPLRAPAFPAVVPTRGSAGPDTPSGPRQSFIIGSPIVDRPLLRSRFHHRHERQKWASEFAAGGQVWRDGGPARMGGPRRGHLGSALRGGWRP